MKRGKPKVQYLMAKTVSMAQGFSEDHPPFCFSCEQMFPDRMLLEEHTCPAASYICSCGTEFGFYMDMLDHSKKHEPGHKVLDHQTILKRRLEKHQQQEEQLRRLEAIEQGRSTLPILSALSLPHLMKGSKSDNPFLSTATWKVPAPRPSLTKAGPRSAVPFLSSRGWQIPSQSAAHASKMSSPPVSQRPLVPNATPPAQINSNFFAGSGAPTVDLWTVYQPVVLVNTLRQFDKERPYKCGKCEQNFVKRSELTLHHNTHTKDNIVGCLGCGLLLSSKKSVPRYHQCNSPSSSLKTRLITAMPLTNTLPNVAFKGRSPAGWAGKLPTATIPRKLQINIAASGSKTHTCRVCGIVFGSLMLLQRHKCVRAQEFVEKQAMFGKQVNRYKKVAPVRSPYPSIQITGNRNLGVAASMYHKTDGSASVGGASPVTKGEMASEDDCYIVDSPPAKTTQMFYQLTSSLPVIKI